MITLDVNPMVLEALKAAFPAPSNSAERALKKYVRVLSSFINRSVNTGRDPLQVRFKLYAVPTSKLANLGGSIGANKERVHRWLEQQGFALAHPALDGKEQLAQPAGVFPDLAGLTQDQAGLPRRIEHPLVHGQHHRARAINKGMRTQ